MALTLTLAVAGALLFAAAAAMVYLPAGVAVAGLELLAAAYVRRYMEVRGEAARTSRP